MDGMRAGVKKKNQKKKTTKAGLPQHEWKLRVSQAGAGACCFAWVGIDMRISILCSTEHLNVLTNAIWVTKIQKIFQREKHCYSAARSFCAIHGCKSPLNDLAEVRAWHSFVIYFDYIKLLLLAVLRFQGDFQDGVSCCGAPLHLTTIAPSFLPPSFCFVILFPSRCVVMSRLLRCPARLIKADTKTGRLYYSSNEICQHRLHSRACRAAALLILAHRRGGRCGELDGGQMSDEDR